MRRASAPLRRLSAAGALAAIGLGGAGVRADLLDDADRLVRLWKLEGADVTRLEPVFAEHGRATIVRLPAAPKAGPDDGGCLTVAFLAHRTVDFALADDLAPDGQQAIDRLIQQLHGQDDEEDERVHSGAGAATITRCGDERDALRHVVLDVLTPRAAFEIVVARSSAPLPKLEAIFPERAPGPVAPRGDPGGPIEPGPLAERVAKADRRARLEGAERVIQAEMRAGSAGTGQFVLRLPEGCHRLDVMAEVPSAVPRRATDVDAEAREADTGRLLARDRADAPDARLDVCVGETEAIEVSFLGASGAVKVALSDAMWSTPRAVPAHFGTRARAGFAGALRRRRAPPPQAQTIVEAMGIQGDTTIPTEIEPGRCYLAAAALVRGEARALRLTVELGDHAGRDDAAELTESAGVAFCAETEETATIRVAARGSSVWWALVVWPMD